MKPTNEKRCVLYARVSTSAQAGEDKTSLDTQMDACRQLAKSKGWVVVGEFQDESTGYNLNRPGLDELRTHVKSGQADFVVVWKTQRLSREQGDTGLLHREFSRQRATIWSVHEGNFDDTPLGKFLLQTYALAAELDRSARRDATVTGKRAKVARGGILGTSPRAPYGYNFRYATKPDGAREKTGYEIDEREALIVRKIYDLTLRGMLPRHIADHLNKEGHRTSFANLSDYNFGGVFYAYTVRRIIKNPVYKGEKFAFSNVRQPAKEGNRYGPITTDLSNAVRLSEDLIPAIVSEEVWDRANEIVANRLVRVINGPDTECVWIRGGLALCGVCGGKMHLTRRKNGAPYLRCSRSCKDTSKCGPPSPSIQVHIIESAAWGVVKQVLADPFVLAAKFRSTEQGEVNQQRLAEIKLRIADLDKRRQRLLTSLEFLDGDDLQTAIKRREDLVRQQQELRSELEALEVPTAHREDELERVLRLAEWLGQHANVLENLTAPEKRAIAVELGLEVTVYPASANDRYTVSLGARTSGAGFFDDTDWSTVSTKPTANERRLGEAEQAEAQSNGQVATTIRALLQEGRRRRNGQYIKWYCGLGLFNELGAAKLVGLT